ncbi:MAG: hydrogenase formation protein HypD [Vulcanimicrobiota bacterium]
MKYLEEFRDPALARRLLQDIRQRVTRPWVLMEVCGGQTHSFMRHGLDQLLPEQIELIHGPGCPICVTPISIIDQALQIAARPEVIFCSFGDMLRVPGSQADLLTVKSRGGQIQVVYSPLEAVELARQNPTRQVVFFAIGFETTAPANAMAALQAERLGLTNFSLLVSQVLVPPALKALLAKPESRVQGLLAAGHVCSVMGWRAYQELAETYRRPIVVTGFEPLDLLEGIRLAVIQLEEGRCQAENAYTRAVRPEGNRKAQEMLQLVFEEVDQEWRGLGSIPASGWKLRERFQALDAAGRFGPSPPPARCDSPCRSGEVLQGLLKPDQCPFFARECNPDHPLGATMVSHEGACAAYYLHRRAQC